MGLNNDINIIKNETISRRQEAEKQKEYKNTLSELKATIKDLLQVELIQRIKEDQNIFDLDFKLYIIDEIIGTYQKNVINENAFLKYKKDIKQFLIINYYSIATQSQLFYKKQIENTNEQQQLKNDILEIKKQQEAEKLKKLQQQNVQRQQKVEAMEKAKRSKKIDVILKIIKFLLVGAIAIVGGFVWMVIDAASKQK